MQYGENHGQDACPRPELQQAEAGDQSGKREQHHEDGHPDADGAGEVGRLPVAADRSRSADDQRHDHGDEHDQTAVDDEAPAEGPNVLRHRPS